MRVLITGITGLLGGALIKTNKDRNSIWGVYLGDYNTLPGKGIDCFKADICDRSAMDKIFIIAKPDIVIHTAGMANVDYCEKHCDHAWNSNVNGTKNMVELCKKNGSKIVFISTNAVFNGENPPYSEINLRLLTNME